MKLKFKLQPGEKYIEVSRAIQLEISISWLTKPNADFEKLFRERKVIFVTDEGEIHSEHKNICRHIEMAFQSQNYFKNILK
jgi:hypothetical protein